MRRAVVAKTALWALALLVFLALGTLVWALQQHPSLQPYAGLKDDVICEYPFTPKSVAWDLCANHIAPDANGEVRVPERPGLGIDASPEGMKRYLVDVEIAAKGKVLYRTPKL